MTPQKAYLPNRTPNTANTPTTTKSFVILLLMGRCFSKLLNARKYAMLAIVKTMSISAKLIGDKAGKKRGRSNIFVLFYKNLAGDIQPKHHDSSSDLDRQIVVERRVFFDLDLRAGDKGKLFEIAKQVGI